MKRDSQNLTARQRLSLPILASEPTVEGAADKIGVTRKTIYEWLKSQAFKDAVDQARREFVDSAFRTLRLASKKAADEIVYRLRDWDPKVSLRAAEDIIEYSKEFISLEDHERRIADLEARLLEAQEAAGRTRPKLAFRARG